MVVIPRNVVVVLSWPPKHTHICTIIATVQAILSYERIVMSGKSTYISTSSPIIDCFTESTVTLDVELINGHFVTLVSALFTGLTLKMTPSWHVYCVCTLHMIT